MVDFGRSSMGLQNTQYDFLVLGLGFGSNILLCLELDEDEEMSSFCHVLLLPQLGAGSILVSEKKYLLLSSRSVILKKLTSRSLLLDLIIFLFHDKKSVFLKI